VRDRGELEVCLDGLINDDLEYAASFADIPDEAKCDVAEVSAQIIDNLCRYRCWQYISPDDDWSA